MIEAIDFFPAISGTIENAPANSAPIPNPAIARPRSNVKSSGLAATMRFPMISSPRPIMMTLRTPIRSAIAPVTMTVAASASVPILTANESPDPSIPRSLENDGLAMLVIPGSAL